MEYQTRSEENGIRIHPTFHLAYETAQRDRTIWKISWALPSGERMLLTRQPDGTFEYEPREEYA